MLRVLCIHKTQCGVGVVVVRLRILFNSICENSGHDKIRSYGISRSGLGTEIDVCFHASKILGRVPRLWVNCQIKTFYVCALCWL